jgi:LPS-assembly protein
MIWPRIKHIEQDDVRRFRLTSSCSGRAGLFAGLAAAVLAWGAQGWGSEGSGAQAKTLAAMAPEPTRSDKPAAPLPDDGLAGGGLYLEADSLTQNQTTHHVIATGGVEIRSKGRVVRAERVDYDSETGAVVASGNVEIIDPDGSAQFADSITLDKDMSAGFAAGFSTRLEGHVLIAAASVERQGGNVTDLRKVIYTPCLVCVVKGQKRPTWSIRARSVVEDKAKKTLTFKDAVVQILGQPVFYFPVLQTADPTAVRKSGFLLPLLTFSGPRGVSYEQPYYQVIDPSQDILITPQINSLVNPFLKLDYRKRFYSGSIEARLGYTYDYDFNSSGDKFGTDTSRSYILADGNFQISKAWSWGFTAQRTSDKLIFDKYSVTDVFTNNESTDLGLYASDYRRLISQIYAVRQDDNSYLSIAAISVQGLRSTDVQSTFPTVAPIIEGRWEDPAAILGGRLRVYGSAVVLTPDQSMSSTGALIPGIDSRRATLQADWQSSVTFSSGVQVQPFLDGRVDLYNVTNNPGGPSNATIPREFGTIGANVSYPLIRRAPGVTYILEPIGQISISPNYTQSSLIPNYDSVDFYFNETNLFNSNRSPGFDLYEGGQAVTLAGRATAILDDGRTASLLIGRRLGFESDPSIPARTGLETPVSDWILAADATPWKGVRLFSQLRLDSQNFSVNEAWVGALLTTPRAEGSVSYVYEAQNPAGTRINSIDIHTALFPLRRWGVTNYFIVDGGAFRREEVGLVYRDDCLRVEVLYRHDETFNGTLGPTTSVLLRLTLATLGNTR